jgi:hypothetical protein
MVETHKDCPDITIIENIVKDAIWRCSHIPQKDGEVDMMLISCNITGIKI